jgi:hypothetical protein
MSLASFPSCTITVLAALTVACSDQLPVAPGATPEGRQYATMSAQPAAGTYELSFLPTNSGLGVILRAHVQDAFGVPAERGTAIFQYCSLHGVSAPSVDCDTGSGNWTLWGRAGIIPSPSPSVGDALMVYDLVPPSGTTIGFRFRYIGQNSGIANGVSASRDFTFP